MEFSAGNNLGDAKADLARAIINSSLSCHEQKSLVGLLAHYRGWLTPDVMEVDIAPAPEMPTQMMTSGAAADRG